jgi:AraC-like DNA-binding protein
VARFKKSLQPGITHLDVPSQEEAFIKKAVEVVEANLSNEDFSVEKMGRALLLDRTQLFRKLKAITGQSPSQFIRSIRLKHAYQLLSRRTATVGEIAFSVGFSSTTYFNRCFKDEYGLTPGDVMAKKDS